MRTLKNKERGRLTPERKIQRTREKRTHTHTKRQRERTTHTKKERYKDKERNGHTLTQKVRECGREED